MITRLFTILQGQREVRELQLSREMFEFPKGSWIHLETHEGTAGADENAKAK